MTLEEFVARWQSVTGTERGLAQSHFIDLCDLLHQPKPASDPTQERYAFEKSVLKTGGGQGFADVWLKGHFAFEYKGKRKNLAAAYDQIRLYEEALQNPPLLVVCDLDRFEVHTRFNGVVKHVYAFDLDDLRANVPTPTCSLPPLDVLRALFEDPTRLRPERTTTQVTEEVAAAFGKIATQLTGRGVDPREAARFLIRLLFCLFAEDVGLLPENLFARLVEGAQGREDRFATRIKALFGAMAEGGIYGNDDIRYFNGGLFEDDSVILLTSSELSLLSIAAKQDWANVEPAIFGTLFERSLDPAKRSQLGAHYTSRNDILAIVEPVLMAPLRRRWAQVQADVAPLVEKREAISAKQAPGVPLTGRDRRDMESINGQISGALRDFGEELGAVRVLDPACGSGNFLYVALRQLLDLNKAISAFATAAGVASLTIYVQMNQMNGIEVNEYAHELASVTVAIGYIQWLRENGFGQPSEPILQTMDNIVSRDAVLAVNDDGTLSEPEWPEADVIVGNPPFLGDKKMRAELGDDYVANLRRLYAGRIPGGADLVCYWFERARALVEGGAVKRVGLISTNSIRIGANRRVLERIKESGDVFLAWSDREWSLEGAAVRVSLVGFDNGSESERVLNGQTVATINPDLSSRSDVTTAATLPENEGLVFLGIMKAGPFDLTDDVAQAMLEAPLNGNGKSNRDVVKPRLGGQDITGRPRGGWLIDFGMGMSEEDAALYEVPFEYVRKHVKPLRDKNNQSSMEKHWWLHGRPRPALRQAISNLSRCIVTPEVAKHRIFVWMPTSTIPDHTTHVIARDDDYCFGVLHSRVHEVWSLAVCNYMGMGNDPRYNSSRTFGTFPFPWPPGRERSEAESPAVRAIADAARALVAARDAWLNPEDATAAILKTRTLTNLYNARPEWLVEAHAALDAAVFSAYSEATGEAWEVDMDNDELLSRLLAINLERNLRAGRLNASSSETQPAEF